VASGLFGDGAAAVWEQDRWLTLCSDGWIRVHDGPDVGRPIRQLTADGVPMARVVAAARMGQDLLLGDLDGNVWMVEDGGVGSLHGPWRVGASPVLRLVPSAEGRFAAATLGDHSMTLLDVAARGTVAGMAAPILATAFPSPGVLRVVTEHETLDLGLPSLDEAPPVLWASEGLSALQVGPHGGLATGDGDGRLVLRDTAGVVRFEEDIGTDPVKGVAWSADGRWVAAGTPHRGPVQVHLDPPSSGLLPGNGLRRVGTLSDGRLLVGTYANQVEVHHPGHARRRLTTGLPIAMVPSRDRRRLLHGSATPWVRLWETDVAEPIVLRDGAEHGRIGLSGSGRRWAFVGAGRGEVRELSPVGDPVSGPGRVVATVAPQRDATVVSLDQEGQRLIIGTLGGEVRVLRVADGAQLAAGRLHTGRVSAMSLGPDNVLWTASWDRRVHRLRLDDLDLATAWPASDVGEADELGPAGRAP